MSQDLKILGYFNIKGYKFTDDDIKKIKKNVATQLILIIEQMKESIGVKIEDGLEKNVLFENDYKYLKVPRFLSHIICDDIVEKFTGKVGIAKNKIFFTADKTGRKQIYQIYYDEYNIFDFSQVNKMKDVLLSAIIKIFIELNGRYGGYEKIKIDEKLWEYNFVYLYQSCKV